MSGWLVWLREHVWEIRFRRYVALLVAAVLVASGVWGGLELTEENRSCGHGLSKPEGSEECVGVATSKYDFGQRQLTDVVNAIDRENSDIAKEAKAAGAEDTHVTVAILEPFTSPDPDTMGDVLHELQGAYLGQRRANDSQDIPKIRLVLASTGTKGVYWEQTVAQLVDMSKDGRPERLRAVTGIGTSNTGNRDAVEALTSQGIPVVGTSITADDLANGQAGAEEKEPFPGLARVAPTNLDLARALITADVEPDRTRVVYAKNGDNYTNTLHDAFKMLLPKPRYEDVWFPMVEHSSEEGVTAHFFSQISRTFCTLHDTTDTVLFAGRHTDLRLFVNALGEHCPTKKFTLLTGDDASYLTGDKKLRTSALRTVTVRYTALAHPDAWTEDPPKLGGSPDATARLNDLIDEAGKALGEVSLADGQLMIAYDAMTLAAHGIREATAPETAYPPLSAVRDEWPYINAANRVDGASGWICLDNYGNPYDKAVPVVELTEDGAPDFVDLAWPEGNPPKEECVKPSDGSGSGSG